MNSPETKAVAAKSAAQAATEAAPTAKPRSQRRRHQNNSTSGNTSGAFEWAHRFFTVHIHHMVEKKVLSPGEGEAMLQDWLAHKENPETVFVSPIVMDMAGRRPS